MILFLNPYLKIIAKKKTQSSKRKNNALRALNRQKKNSHSLIFLDKKLSASQSQSLAQSPTSPPSSSSLSDPHFPSSLQQVSLSSSPSNGGPSRGPTWAVAPPAKLEFYYYYPLVICRPAAHQAMSNAKLENSLEKSQNANIQYRSPLTCTRAPRRRPASSEVASRKQRVAGGGWLGGDLVRLDLGREWLATLLPWIDSSEQQQQPECRTRTRPVGAVAAWSRQHRSSSTDASFSPLPPKIILC